MNGSSKGFRAVTYNVHKCRGLDLRVDEARIADVLGEMDADIVALQEVLDRQAETIAQALGTACVLGVNRRHRGGGYGNVVLARGDIAGSRNHDLTVRGREPRGCLRADVVLPGAPLLHVFNVHLGTSHFERREQGPRLVADDALCDVSLTGAKLLLGDFNEWTSGLATQLLCAHLESVDLRVQLRRTRTYPAVLPMLHLDHIYHDRRLRLKNLIWPRSRKTLLASDHLPLGADFEWVGVEEG